MALTNAEAASLGLLLVSAMDMYELDPPPPNPLTPPLDQRVSKAGWALVGYLSARKPGWKVVHYLRHYHAHVAKKPVIHTEQEADYHGFVVRHISDPSQHLVVLRGTGDVTDWIENLKFTPIPYPPDVTSGAMVEDGFWGIYASLTVLDTAGAVVHGNAAEGIAALVGNGRVRVIGHSLGSALATYLALDLARNNLGDRVSACLFASPQPGNAAFAALFDETVKEYRVFNYILDIIPRVPHGMGYVSLPKVTLLHPATADADIKLDPLCHHRVASYSAMLDYDIAKALAENEQNDESYAFCVRGPEHSGWTLAKILAATLAAD